MGLKSYALEKLTALKTSQFIEFIKRSDKSAKHETGIKNYSCHTNTLKSLDLRPVEYEIDEIIVELITQENF